jgi:hypothetical protein
MADFEHEQLKSLFERLAERLDKTAGDEEHLAMLTSLRSAIIRLQKEFNKPGAAQRTGTGDSTVIQEFLRDWQDTLKDFKGGPGSPGGVAGSKGTLLQQYANDALEETTKGQKRAQERTAALGSAFKNVKESLTGFDKSLDGSAAGLAAMLGMGQGAAGKMFGAIDDNVEMYRNLRQTGESSIDSIYGMRGAAQDFALTTKQFSDAIAKGTDGARQLGAIRFGDINKRFRDATSSVGRFGLSIDESIAVQGTYLEMLRDQGNLNTMDNGEIASGMEQLVRSSNITSSILGKTRDEVLKARENQTQDANFQTYLRTMSSEQQTALTNAATHIAESMGPAAAQMFKEQVMTGGAVITEQSASRAALSPQEAQLLNGLREQITSSGRFDQDMQTAFATQQRDLANSRSDIHNQQFAILGAAGNSLSDMITGINAGVISQTQLTPEKANDGSETDAAINTMVAFEETMAKLNAQFQEIIDKILEPILMSVGPRVVSFLSGTADVLGKLSQSGWGLAAAIGLAVAGFATLKIALGLFHGFMMKQVIGGIGRMLGGVGGRGAGAIGGRLLGGVAGRGALAAGASAAGGAGLGALALAGGGILAGGAGLFAGNRMVANNAGESAFGTGEGEGGLLSSRAAGYGTSAASGALAGAAIGSIVPVLGTAIGAAIGGVVGLGAAGVQDYMSNRNRPESRISPDNRQARAANPQNPQNAAAAAPGARANRTTPEMINQRIATLTETGNGHLRMIMENNRIQLEVMRQELAEARGYYAASLRLNEETIRTIRQAGAVN